MKNVGGRGGSGFARTVGGVRVKLELYEGKIIRRLNTKKRKVLFALGKYLKTTMQHSMRYREGPSKPGQPPSAHRDKKLGIAAGIRNNIRFDVDLNVGSVVCGPGKFQTLSQPSGMTVPELLDKGGPVFAQLEGQSVIAQIESRPFTSPVFTDGGKRFDELLEEVKL